MYKDILMRRIYFWHFQKIFNPLSHSRFTFHIFYKIWISHFEAKSERKFANVPDMKSPCLRVFACKFWWNLIYWIFHLVQFSHFMWNFTFSQSVEIRIKNILQISVWAEENDLCDQFHLGVSIFKLYLQL